MTLILIRDSYFLVTLVMNTESPLFYRYSLENSEAWLLGSDLNHCLLGRLRRIEIGYLLSWRLDLSL